MFLCVFISSFFSDAESLFYHVKEEKIWQFTVGSILCKFWQSKIVISILEEVINDGFIQNHTNYSLIQGLNSYDLDRKCFIGEKLLLFQSRCSSQGGRAPFQ